MLRTKLDRQGASPLHWQAGTSNPPRFAWRGTIASLAASAIASAVAAFVTTLATLIPVGTTQASPGQLGVSLDVGVPDGGATSLSVAPLSMLRLHAGLSHNLVSPGVRLGATLVPLSTWITPTLSLDWGHYLEGDANPMARRLSGDDSFHSPVLARFAYDYANAHLGLELGRSWGTFYLHAGVSRITAVAHQLDAELQSDADAMSGDTTVTFPEDPAVTVWTVSARLGFIVYFTR